MQITVKYNDEVLGTYDIASFNKEVVSFGRQPDNDIVLDYGFVSRVHGVFYYEDGILYAEDIGSTNGIKVNGEDVRRTAISSGDVISVQAKGSDDMITIVAEPDMGEVPQKSRKKPVIIALAVLAAVAVIAAVIIFICANDKGKDDKEGTEQEAVSEENSAAGADATATDDGAAEESEEAGTAAEEVSTGEVTEEITEEVIEAVTEAVTEQQTEENVIYIPEPIMETCEEEGSPPRPMIAINADYDQIIRQYRDFAVNQTSYDELIQIQIPYESRCGHTTYCIHASENYYWDEVAYYLADLDGNGTDELCISALWFNDGLSKVWDVYTLKNGHAVRLMCSGERWETYYCGDYFVRYGSSGAAYYSVEKIVIENGDTRVTESAFSMPADEGQQDSVYYHRYGAAFETADSTAISYDDMMAYQNSWIVGAWLPGDPIPLSNYTN